MRKALTIAGTDCSGGAGIQADLMTFAAHAVYGLSAVTAVTVQNSRGVRTVHDLPAAIIEQQVVAVFDDVAPDAVKIGMLYQAAAIAAVADTLAKYDAKNVVLDPVMISSSGHQLLQPGAEQALIERLLPLTDLLTPNIAEAERLSGLEVTDVARMEQAALAIARLGPRAVLVKGGHLKGEPVDVLFDGRQLLHFPGRRVKNRNTHGTGCTLSSAIAANLAKRLELADAVLQAKQFLELAIQNELRIGQGAGMANHLCAIYQKAGVLIVD